MKMSQKKLYDLRKPYTGKDNINYIANMSRMLLMSYETYIELRHKDPRLEHILLLTRMYTLTSTIYTRFWTVDGTKSLREIINGLEDSNFRRFWLLYILEHLQIISVFNFNLDAMAFNGWDKKTIKSIGKEMIPVVKEINNNLQYFINKVQEKDYSLAEDEYEALKSQDCLFPEPVDNIDCLLKKVEA